MEKKIYINYTELIKVCSWEQQTTLHKAMYLYDHSRRYIKRRVDGKDNITVLQIKFNDEEKLNKFLEIMRDEHIELINPETMEKIKEKINDYVHIVISKDKLEISEQYASIGVSGHSVYRNTDEYTYSVSKNERDGTVLLKRIEVETNKEIILDAFDYKLSKIVNRIETFKLS